MVTNNLGGTHADSRVVTGRKVIVVGAGLCGLTAAYRLKQQGFEPVVLDRSDYTGGRTKTVEKNGYLMELGACLFPTSYKDALALTRELDLTGHLHPVRTVATVETGHGSYRFDLDHPMRTLFQVPGLRLIDMLSLLRLVPPMLRYWRALRFDDLSGAAPIDGETAEELCSRRITANAYRLLVNPLLRTVYAVNGNQISAATMLWILKRFASVFKNFSTPYMMAFDGGMQTLAKRIASHLDVRKNCRVSRVERKAECVTVHLEKDGVPTVMEADYCVIATDGRDLQRLYGHDLTARQNRFLRALIYMPLKMITFHTSTRPDTDALMIQVLEESDPEVCIIMIDHQFCYDRAPNGKGSISFLGMYDWQMRMADRPEAECIADARVRVSHYLPFLKTSEEAVFMTPWPRGALIGQVGIIRQLADFVADMKHDRHVFYAGDYLSQTCVNTAVATGNAVARRLVAAAKQAHGQAHAAPLAMQISAGERG